MEKIISRKNPLIVETAKLKDRKWRKATGHFFFEGRKLLTEAIAAGVTPEYLFLAEGAQLPAVTLPPETRVFSVTDEVYAKLSEEKSPQGIICVAKHLDNLHNCYIIDGSNFSAERVFLLSHMQDPGNLGTILRTAYAMGFDRVLLSQDSADLYHPRTIRASMGAIFRMQTTTCADMTKTIATLRAQGFTVLAAALGREAALLGTFPVHRQTAFLVGNEGQGLTAAEIEACTGTVLIPMAEGAESLNVSAAAAMLMWEASRTHS